MQYAATQLSLEPASWSQYIDGRRPTISEHQTLIRQQYGYRDFTHPAVQFSTIRWLYTRAWLHDEPPSCLFDLLVLRLKESKVLLPGITTLEELINHIRSQVSLRIWARVNRQLTESQRKELQKLVPPATTGWAASGHLPNKHAKISAKNRLIIDPLADINARKWEIPNSGK